MQGINAWPPWVCVSQNWLRKPPERVEHAALLPHGRDNQRAGHQLGGDHPAVAVVARSKAERAVDCDSEERVHGADLQIMLQCVNYECTG